jgi:hypothetical protein
MFLDDRGSMFCNRVSGRMFFFFFDIDVKGGESCQVQNVSGTESSLNVRIQSRKCFRNRASLKMQRSSRADSSPNTEQSRARKHMGVCVAINDKGGDCWQILYKQRMRVGKRQRINEWLSLMATDSKLANDGGH